MRKNDNIKGSGGVYMNANHLVSARTVLNQYVHHLEPDGASFYVHCWGAMPNHYHTLVHKHSFFEICYVIKGNGYYLECGCQYPLKENTIFMSRPEILHQIKSETGLSILYVDFELNEDRSSAEWRKAHFKAFALGNGRRSKAQPGWI